jgi:hypothetical protein
MGKLKQIKGWIKKYMGPNVAIAAGTAEAHHAAKHFNKNTIANVTDKMSQKLVEAKKEQERIHLQELEERRKFFEGVDPNAPMDKMPDDKVREEFQKLRSETLNVLMRQWGNDFLHKSSETIPALVAAIRAADEYEWVLKTVGGQEILLVAGDLENANKVLQERMGDDIAARANKIFFSCKTLAELDAERAKFDEIRSFWNNDVQGLVIAVVNRLMAKFRWEVWKAADELWKKAEVRGEGWIGPLAAIAKGIISAAQKAAPPGWGVSAASAGANGIIDECKLHAENRVRDKKIRQVMARMPKDAPFRFLDEHKAAMAQRVQKVQEANTTRIMNVVNTCGLAEVPGWTLVSSIIAGAVNGYYQGQVERLKVKIGETDTPIETVKEVLSDIKDSSLDTLEQKVASKLTELVLAASPSVIAKAFTNFLGEAVATGTDILIDLAGKITKKLVAMVMAELGGPCAQEVTGAALEHLMAEIANHASNLQVFAEPVSGAQRTA